ncbi:MAG: DUF928 domain-containing protein [Leptolyngbyaceae cyanobacterium MO_188.B28]|nr:DUF928 domain-containing protein [Leptolyngbyaceae cyanobacterium MO_188.B28]
MKINWIKSLILTITFLFLICLIYSLPPKSHHPYTQIWSIQPAQANWLRDLIDRLGLSDDDDIQLGGLPPGRQKGGAGRGPICHIEDGEGLKSLAAIMPAFEITQNDQLKVGKAGETEMLSELQVENLQTPVMEDVGGKTVSKQPTFWFYIPYVVGNGSTRNNIENITQTNVSTTKSGNNIRVGKLVLLDNSRKVLSSDLFAIKLLRNPQIVGFQLPYALEVNKPYSWHFSVICEPEKPSKNPVVRGWVKRIESPPELETALENARPYQKYLAYADNEIWFEMLSELTKTRNEFPDLYQSQQDWYDLLSTFVSVLNPETLELTVTEPIDHKEAPRRQSQLPAKI